MTNLGLNAIPGRQTKKIGFVHRKYLSTCLSPECRRGIYDDEDRVRLRRPFTGLTHLECVPEGAE